MDVQPDSYATGSVKWFNDSKGYGFIQITDLPEAEKQRLEDPKFKKDVFVHYSSVNSPEGFKTLEEGEEVRFELTEGPKGLFATNVSRVTN